MGRLSRAAPGNSIAAVTTAALAHHDKGPVRLKPSPVLKAVCLAFCLASMIARPAAAARPALEISLAHGNPAEIQTRDALVALAQTYDLTRWTWTHQIVIEQYAVPHSDPVLTLNTRHQDLALLSSYVHEQLHRYEDLHPAQTAAAVDAFEQTFPDLPVGGLDGGKDRASTYLHVVTCYSEYEAMKQLVGPARARDVIEELAKDHYRAIYRLVLDQETAIGEVVDRYNLMPR